MADIRINSLPSTATSFNTDDYIAIDGASGGTRKMLAATLPLTDVTLGGSSGPSVKSTLSARAPRQGLVFDGTNSSSFSFPALGTSDFTISFWVNRTQAFANYQPFVGTSTADVFAIYGNNSGLRFEIGNGTSYQEPYLTNLGSASVIGQTELWTVTVSRSGNIVSYLNGVAKDTIAVTLGTSVSMPSSTGLVGGFWVSGTPKASISGPLIYNRALSASEVVSLYEAGAPAGADYNSASNTSLSTSALTAFSPFTLYSTFSSANGTSFSASDASANRACATNASFSVSAGQKILVSFTLTQNGSDFPQVILCDPTGPTDSSNAVVSTAGANNITLTATRAGTVRVRFFSFAASNYSVANLSVTRLGLLLAPDAAQAGGGLVWYDTSGNAANITLPASGVSWNVPSSRVLGGNWTNTGNLTISGTDYNYVGGNKFFRGFTNYNVLYTGATELSINNQADGANLASFKNNGNFLIGTNVDSSALLQVGTNTTTAAGGMKFGTDTSLYRYQAGGLALDATNNVPALMLRQSGTNALFAYTSSLIGYIGTPGAYSLNLQTNNTTALTLDSSQVATFASDVKISASTGTYYGGTSTGGGGFANNNASAYMLAYGSSNATYPSQLQFNSGGAVALRIDGSQNATFTGNVTVSAGKYLRTPDVRDGTSTNDRLVHTSSTTAVFAGGSTWTNAALYAGGAQRLAVSATACSLDVPLKLNNAFQAGAPTATGYVTIQDSAGNTYKVLVGT